MNTTKRIVSTLLGTLFLSFVPLVHTGELAHMATNQQARERLHVCNKCGSSFYRSDHLKRHIVAHSQNKFKCPQPNCDRTFSYKSNLRRHTKSHSGQRPFQCNCGKRFTRNDILKRHQQSPCCIRHQNKSEELTPTEIQPQTGQNQSPAQLLLALQERKPVHVQPFTNTATSLPCAVPLQPLLISNLLAFQQLLARLIEN